MPRIIIRGASGKLASSSDEAQAGVVSVVNNATKAKDLAALNRHGRKRISMHL